MKTQQITVGELVNQVGQAGPRAILHCRECGGEFSANAGDYFQLPKDHVMRCCGKPLCRVFKVKSYTPSFQPC